MLPLTGYADRLSVRPGETIRFHVSNATANPAGVAATASAVAASMVRVISADPNPAGMGIKTAPVASAGLRELTKPQAQTPPRGSYAIVADRAELQQLQSFTLIVTITAVARANDNAAVFSIGGATSGAPSQVVLGVSGGVVHADIGAHRIAGKPHDGEAVWSTVFLSFDHISGTASLGHAPVSNSPRFAISTNVIQVPNAKVGGPLLLGAGMAGGVAVRHFNGRIERPMIFNRALTPDEIVSATHGTTPSGLVAAWDFAREMHTSHIFDTGPHALHGKLVNTPTRAVRGSNWTGREQCYRHAPEQYGAIHFHVDDIDNCHWPATHEYTVPADLKSGSYALMLNSGDASENIPFFVVPPKGTQTAKIAVLVSTFTYTVYGNHARPEWTWDPKWKAAWLQQMQDWKGYPNNPGDHSEYGLSTYNHHPDGSGIAIASWHRPMLNLRIGYVTYPYPDIRASGLRHYPADQHLLAWLEAKGHAFDLVTDWELHHEGAELLSRYACVMTGSHPEYHTTEMLDALESYRDGGGCFMYLGGNGFYWKIALSPDQAGVIEIRRAEGGIRAWAAEPGEYYNQFDGEYGGLWRRNGRPPQKLAGVGFTAQGNFVGSHYRVTQEGRANPKTAWMFDGITDDVIGGFGFSGHGAAGFELDRTDKRLGTPDNAVVVARSENHPPDAPWVLVPEEQLTHLTTIPGETHKQLIRADMTYFETAKGGAVFSTGSITFCGSLPHNDFDNSISTLLGNVLRRFTAET